MSSRLRASQRPGQGPDAARPSCRDRPHPGWQAPALMGRPDDVHSPHPAARTGPSCPIALGPGHATCFQQQGGRDATPTTAHSRLVRRCEGGTGRKRGRENPHGARAWPPNWVRCPTSLPRACLARVPWGRMRRVALRPEGRVASGEKPAPWRPRGAPSVERPPSRPGCRVPARGSALGRSVTALWGCEASRFPGLCSNFVSTGSCRALSPRLVYALEGVSCQGGGSRQAVVTWGTCRRPRRGVRPRPGVGA